MTDNNITITQKSALGSETTQIAHQTNYYGITPEEASQMAIELFMNNFPKLQEEAMKVARERADELMQNVISEINEKHFGDYSAFSNPDMQYILFEAQKGYARRGTRELCTILSSLIADRSACEVNSYLEAVLDRAIELVPSLTAKQLDYLTLLFTYKHIRFGRISTLEDIKNNYTEIHDCFKSSMNYQMISYLDMLGIVSINIGSGADMVAKRYGFSVQQVKEILPPEHETIAGDYGLTPVGIVLAIFNAHIKSNFRFRLETFIHE